MDRLDAIPRYVVRRYGLLRTYLLDQRFLPRWVVLTIDLCICLFSYSVTVLLLSGTSLQSAGTFNSFQRAVLLALIHLVAFILFRSYSGIIRHSTFTDVYRLALATVSVFLVAMAGNSAYEIVVGTPIYSWMDILLYSILSFIFLVAFRVIIKETYHYLKMTAAHNDNKKRIVIFGVSDKSIGLAQSLVSDVSSPYRPVAFFSISEKKSNFKIMNLPVLNCCEDMEEDLRHIK